MTGFAERPPWSLLQTQWLDVPIRVGADHANPTWEAFSASFDVCLQGVHLHLARRVSDRAHLESAVTEVLVDHLDILVSQLGNQEKLRHLLAIADRLLESAFPGPRRRD